MNYGTAIIRNISLNVPYYMCMNKGIAMHELWDVNGNGRKQILLFI